jgi:hypothetical protein
MTEEAIPRPDRLELQRALRDSWSRHTSSDPEGWSPENPAWGQCAVTALVIQRYLGGDLLRTAVDGRTHYWNLLPTEEAWDLTVEQFGRSAPFRSGELRSRDYVFSFPATVERYRRLLERTQSRVLVRAAT